MGRAVEKVDLPGIGTRHDVITKKGRRIGVVSHRSGEREFALFGVDDPDEAVDSIALPNDEAAALADVPGLADARTARGNPRTGLRGLHRVAPDFGRVALFRRVSWGHEMLALARTAPHRNRGRASRSPPLVAAGRPDRHLGHPVLSARRPRVRSGGFAPLDVRNQFFSFGSELGAILLLVMLGLEYSPTELITSLQRSRTMGILDFLPNTLPGAVCALILGWSPAAAVALAGISCVSSFGVIARVLRDLRGLGNR